MTGKTTIKDISDTKILLDEVKRWLGDTKNPLDLDYDSQHYFDKLREAEIKIAELLRDAADQPLADFTSIHKQLTSMIIDKYSLHESGSLLISSIQDPNGFHT